MAQTADINDTDEWDIFFPKKPKAAKIIDHVDSPQSRKETIVLYRGMDIRLEDFESNQITLSPNKSEQQVIWFSRDIGYATIRGREYLLTYPLEVVQHYRVVHYKDGYTLEQTPKEIVDKAQYWKDCKYNLNGIELPDGWLWSYKSDKHIVCKKQITVTKDMFSKNESSFQ